MKAKYSCGSIIGNDVSIISGTLGLSAVGFVECIGTFRYMGSGMWGSPNALSRSLRILFACRPSDPIPAKVASDDDASAGVKPTPCNNAIWSL